MKPTLTFRAGNKIPFGQDFAFFRGLPSGIPFTVDEILPSGLVKLVGPGYGELGFAGADYGNGALHACSAHVVRRAKRAIAKEAGQSRSSTATAPYWRLRNELRAIGR